MLKSIRPHRIIPPVPLLLYRFLSVALKQTARWGNARKRLTSAGTPYDVSTRSTAAFRLTTAINAHADAAVQKSPPTA